MRGKYGNPAMLQHVGIKCSSNALHPFVYGGFNFLLLVIEFGQFDASLDLGGMKISPKEATK